jgi:hypothetical protein
MSTSTEDISQQCFESAGSEPTLGEPEWHEIHTVRKKGCTTMDKFAELGHSLNEMGVDELSDPLWRLLAVLCLQLDFKYTIPTAQG